MAGLPKTIRGAVAVLLSVILLPVVPHPRPMPDDMLAMGVILASETCLGIAIGLTGALMLHGITLAGEVTSMQMGLSLGQALGNMPEGTTVGVGQLQGYFALTIYLSLGGHLILYQGFAASFAAVPAGEAVNGLLGGHQLALLAGTVFTTAIRASAPIIVALLLAHLALAILGKAVPQLNVMMVSFPITIAIGLVMLGASLPFLATFLSGTVESLPGLVGQTIHNFGPAPAVR
jgi:flagellar biosynthetic protein FliR